MIDRKVTVGHTFLGLKILQWLLINFKIKSDLLSMIHTRPSEISTDSYFFLYLLPCVILRSRSTYFCSSHPCQLPSPVSLQYTPFKFRAMNHWSYFSPACSALFNLLCHHLCWSPLAQPFSSSTPYYSNGLLLLLP